MDSHSTVCLICCVRLDMSQITGVLISYFDHFLDIIGDKVTGIQFPVVTSFVANSQKLEHLPLLHSNMSSNLCQSFICSVACLINHAYIKEIFLLFEQSGTELPEFLGSYSQNSCARLMH